MSDVTVTELARFLCAYARSLPNADAGASFLAVPAIGDADDGEVEHRRVAEQIFFDLARIDVLSVSDDHVLYAPDDAAVTRRIERRQVAGMQLPGYAARHVGVTGPAGLPRKPGNLAHQISGDCGHLTRRRLSGAVRRLEPWRRMARRSRTMLSLLASPIRRASGKPIP